MAWSNPAAEMSAGAAAWKVSAEERVTASPQPSSRQMSRAAPRNCATNESGGAGLGDAGGAQGSRWLLKHPLQAEAADRALRSVSHQMVAVKFPRHRDLAGLNFDGAEMDHQLIL